MPVLVNAIPEAVSAAASGKGGQMANRSKILQIRTISHDDERRFDADVNEALRDGWYIEKRYTVVVSGPLFVAEMRRYIDADSGEVIGAW